MLFLNHLHYLQNNVQKTNYILPFLDLVDIPQLTNKIHFVKYGESDFAPCSQDNLGNNGTTYPLSLLTCTGNLQFSLSPQDVSIDVCVQYNYKKYKNWSNTKQTQGGDKQAFILCIQT